MPNFLSFDDRFLFAKKTGDVGITEQTKNATAPEIQKAVANVEQQLKNHSLGFVEELQNVHDQQAVRDVFEKLRWADTLVVIGIGGSDLGARAVQQAVEGDPPPMRVLFHGDSTDPEAIRLLLKKISLEKTIFNIVSKSGQTIETTAQYLFLKTLLKKETGEWQKHFVFTTDAKAGILRQEADQFGILTVPIPDSVGGRFSVLTPVGLLPSLAMGVNIDEMIHGALEFAQSEVMRQEAQRYAATQFQLYQQGIKLSVIMPYSVQLEEFARWFRQLWAESLGKNGKGILPIQARGPADQHSQGQYYNEGAPILSLLFLLIEKREHDYQLVNVDLNEMKYLEGHSFHEIVNVEQLASALALKKQGRPSAVLHIAELTPQTLGQLFMFFELAVVYLAEMIGVNAFNQPGVEEGKKMMYAFFGRDGFAEKKREIDALLNS